MYVNTITESVFILPRYGLFAMKFVDDKWNLLKNVTHMWNKPGTEKTLQIL